MTKKSDTNTNAQHTATLAALGKDAKAINASFVKATKLDGQADDNRLAAAIRIAAAKATCDKVKINFKKWCEDCITEQSYENVRKLAAIGASDNPAQALADARDKNKAANKSARERTTAAKPAKSSVVGAVLAVPTDFDLATQAIGNLNETGQVELCRSLLSKLGFAVIKKSDLEALHAHAEKVPYAVHPRAPQPIGDIGDIPTALKRAPAKRARKTAKRNAA